LEGAMTLRTRILLPAALAMGLGLGLASPARASVEIQMTVEGSHGPFTTRGTGAGMAMKVTSTQLDLAPTGGPVTAPKPVTVVRPTDDLSWQFLGALASSDVLRITITTTQTDSDSGVPHRRVVTLTGARITAIQGALTGTDKKRADMGSDTITLSYERLDVEDDGARVYSAG
jgi:hypothetical protein